MNTSKPKGEDNRRVPLGKVPLSERLACDAEELSSLSPIGMTRIRSAIKDGSLPAKKHGRSTIVLMEDFRAWLKALPDAGSESVAA